LTLLELLAGLLELLTGLLELLLNGHREFAWACWSAA